MIYKVKDWNIHFENDRSRSRLNCSFVCVPNKQHGMGFSRIMSEPDGAAIYGVWHMIIGACSQQKKRDGWMTDDGEQAGSPWGVDDLVLKFRRPAQEIQRALGFLSSKRVEWLVVIEESPSTHRQLTVNSQPTAIEGRKEGKEEKEGKVALLPPTLKDVFDGWNAMAEASKIPQCLVLSDKRKRSLISRLNDYFFESNWRSALVIISNSKFCNGENDRKWKASFDWFIQPDTVAKTMEGKYSNSKSSNFTRSGHIPEATYDSSIEQK